MFLYVTPIPLLWFTFRRFLL